MDDFCSTTRFGHVMSRVVVLQKLEFTILSEHGDDVVACGKFPDFFKLLT